MVQASEIPGNKRAFPVLTTARLIMREFSLSDVPAVFEMLRRDDMNEWLETDPLKSIAEAETRVRSRMGLFNDRMGIRWAITQRADPERVIGSCGYFSVRREFGFWKGRYQDVLMFALLNHNEK
jgi:ribosomal-protein-alanine N-acetyltransferase